MAEKPISTESVAVEPTAAPLGVQGYCIVGLLIIAIFATLYLAGEVFFPIFLAIIANFLLSPAVRFLRKFHLPDALGAGLVLLVALLVASIGLYELLSPAAHWVQQAPQTLEKIKGKFESIREPIERITSTTRQIEQMTSLDGMQGNDKEHDKEQDKASDGDSDPKKDKDSDNDKQPAPPPAPSASHGVLHAVLSTTGSVIATFIVTIVLIYFLLSSGDIFLRKIVESLTEMSEKREAVEMSRDMERGISYYLVTTTLINSGLGLAIGLALWAIGMPNPALWGVMATLVNFIPYAGPFVGIAVVALVALITFDQPWRMIAAPGAYFLINEIENNFVTPTIVGRRLSLNPVIIIVWIMLWGWMWGAGGAFLAVPLLACVKIFCEHIESLKPVAIFLGGDEDDEKNQCDVKAAPAKSST